ncbi:MAG: F0F1 ATP synthase subunit B [Sporichthyaceae bacterium]
MLRLAYGILAADPAPGAEEESEDIFLIPNATFFVELVLFAIVLAVVWKYVVPPVSAAMQARADKLAKQGADAEAATRMLTDATAAYDAAMANTRGEVTRLREQARAEHKAVVDAAAAEAQAEADRITAAARAQIRSERDSAVATLQAEVGELSKSLAGRIVGEPV